jgi:hypothetical protein
MEVKMAELEQELLGALQALDNSSTAEKPCGCQEAVGAAETGESDLFAFDQLSSSMDLGAELDSALDSLLSEAGSELTGLESLSVEDELEFAALEEGPTLSLEDILEITEKYPGLKITFSY